MLKRKSEACGKLYVWVGVLVLSYLLMAGCSNQGTMTTVEPVNTEQDHEGNPQYEPESSNNNESKPVELVFFSLGNAPEETFEALYGDAIRSQYPHFTLKYIPRGGASIDEYMTNLMMSDTVDINFDSIGNIPPLLQYDLGYNMTDLINKHQIDLNALEPAAVEGMRVLSDGQMYGVPVFNTNRLLFYNKDLFDKFGVSYPTDGMTWDEAIELGRRMTRSEDGIQYVGLSSSKEHQIRMNALSVPLVDPDTGKATINTDDRWRTIFTKGLFEPYDDSGYREEIKSSLPFRSWFYRTKILAMMVYLSFLPANEPGPMSEMNWDMVSEPYYVERPGVSSQVYPTYFSIMSSSRHKDEAMQAIQVLISEEHQSFLSRQGQMPVHTDEQIKEVLGRDTPYPDKNWPSVFYNNYAEVPYKSVYDIDIEKIYLREHLEFARGEIDLNTLLRNAEEEANNFLQSVKN